MRERSSWLLFLLGLAVTSCGVWIGDDDKPSSASAIPAGAPGAVGADYPVGAGGHLTTPKRDPRPPPKPKPAEPPPDTSVAPTPKSAPVPQPEPSSSSPGGTPL